MLNGSFDLKFTPMNVPRYWHYFKYVYLFNAKDE